MIGPIQSLIQKKYIIHSFVKKFNIFYFIFSQQETSTAGSLNALTIYIISCMIFVSIAMIYYGMLLYLLRKPSNTRYCFLQISKVLESSGDIVHSVPCLEQIIFQKKTLLYQRPIRKPTNNASKTFKKFLNLSKNNTYF